MDNPIKEYHDNGNIKNEQWYQNGKQHHIVGPAFICYYDNGNIEREYWYINGKQHRINGPAEIWYYENGKIESEEWYLNDNQIFPPYNEYPLSTEQQIEMKLKYG